MPSLPVSPRGLRLMRVTAAGSSVDQPQLLLLTVFLRQFGRRRDAVTAIAVRVFCFSPPTGHAASLKCLATNAPESSVVTTSYGCHQAVEVGGTPRKSSIHNHDSGCSRLDTAWAAGQWECGALRCWWPLCLERGGAAARALQLHRICFGRRPCRSIAAAKPNCPPTPSTPISPLPPLAAECLPYTCCNSIHPL